MFAVTGGATDVTTYFKLHKTADGLEATGLTITDLDLQYTRSGEVPTAKVDAVALAATNTAHTDSRAIEVDATDQPGVYRVDWPDAAFVAGVKEVILTVKHASCWTEDLRCLIDAPVNVTKVDGSAASASTITEATIADAVWDEVQGGHTTSGTFGQYLDSQVSLAGGGSLTASDVADAVWDEAVTDHAIAGSFGGRVGTALPDALPDAPTGLVSTAAFEARTLAAASYATAASQTTIASYIDTEIGTLVTNVATIMAAVDTEIGTLQTTLNSLVTTVGVDGAGLTEVSVSNAGKSAIAVAIFDETKSSVGVGSWGGFIDGLATQASVNAVPTVSEIWETALTEAYRATGATGTGAQLMYELLGNLINFANAGTRRTVTKLDKATTAKEYDYDDGSNPTACEEFS